MKIRFKIRKIDLDALLSNGVKYELIKYVNTDRTTVEFFDYLTGKNVFNQIRRFRTQIKRELSRL